MSTFQRFRWSRCWELDEDGISWMARQGSGPSTPWADVASVQVRNGGLVVRPTADGPRLVVPATPTQPSSDIIGDLLRLLPRRLLDGDVETFLRTRWAGIRSIESARQPTCACGGDWGLETADLTGTFGGVEVTCFGERHRRCPRCGATSPVAEEQVGNIATELDAARSREGDGRHGEVDVTAKDLFTRRRAGRYRARPISSDRGPGSIDRYDDLALATLDAFVTERAAPPSR